VESRRNPRNSEGNPIQNNITTKSINMKIDITKIHNIRVEII
jgi:hypothetical protein